MWNESIILIEYQVHKKESILKSLGLGIEPELLAITERECVAKEKGKIVRDDSDASHDEEDYAKQRKKERL